MQIESGFVAGTIVHTKNGLVPIEQIKIGDLVLSKQENSNGEPTYKQVVNTFVHKNREVWVVDYVVQNEMASRSLVVTGDLPFWVMRVGWRSPGKNLAAGDDFELFNAHENRDCYLIRDAMKIFETGTPDVGWTYDYTNRDFQGPTIDLRDGKVNVTQAYVEDTYNDAMDGEFLRRQVFNIEVEDFHTYYVGEAGVWVHDANFNNV